MQQTNAYRSPRDQAPDAQRHLKGYVHLGYEIHHHGQKRIQHHARPHVSQQEMKGALWDYPALGFDLIHMRFTHPLVCT